MEKISAVYKIVNTVTNDCYVGSSKNVRLRWLQHKRPSVWKKRPNKPLYQDMQKYGVDKFRFKILAPVMPEYLTQVEQELIEILHPTYNVIRAKGTNYKGYYSKYDNKICFYNGERLTFRALGGRFRRAGIKHAMLESKKYLLNQQ